MVVRLFVLLIIATLGPTACVNGDDDDDGAFMPMITTAPNTTSPDTGDDPEYLCEPGAECRNDEDCGDMECILFDQFGNDPHRACAVSCSDDDDCYAIPQIGTAKCDEVDRVCMRNDKFAGECHALVD